MSDSDLLLALGLKLSLDLEQALSFIAEEFTGDPPHWFDACYRDLHEWDQATRV